MGDGVEGSRQIKKKKYNALTIINSTHDIIMHTNKSSFTAMERLVGRLQWLVKVVT